jgi:L-asparagine transporter-like permease
MLYTLDQFEQAPRIFGKFSSGHVPAAAVTVSAVLMLIGVALNYVVPVANVASCCGSRRRWARARASSGGPRCGTA